MAASQMESLLSELHEAGIILALANGALRVDAPPGALTPARKAAITEHRQALKALVASRWRSREECFAKQPCRLMTRCAAPVYGRPCTVPATCCMCGAPLPHDRRMLCESCSGDFTTNQTKPTHGEES
jgi:hypothetical protein